MGNSQSADISEQEAASISKLTGFTKSQIQKIYHRCVTYTYFDCGNYRRGKTEIHLNFCKDLFNLTVNQRAFSIEMIYWPSQNLL